MSKNKLHLVEQEKESVDTYWKTFCDSIVGQEHVKEQFKPMFEGLYFGMKYGFPDNSVAGSILLCGPTGVGKGEFARALAKTFHKSERNLMTVNLGEYHSAHEAARLVGAPPGYLGHRETQPILSQQRINSVASEYCSYSFILWDECEKAHPDVFNVLLNMLDRANVRLSDGNLVTMDRTFHIFTSNLGNKYEKDTKKYLTEEELTQEYKDVTQRRAINKFFRKEFLGRIREQFFFRQFNDKELREIFKYELEKVFFKPCQYLYSRGVDIVSLQCTSTAIDKILELSNTEEFGAREIRNQILKYLYTCGLHAFEDYNLKDSAHEVDNTILFKLSGKNFTAEIKPRADK